MCDDRPVSQAEPLGATSLQPAQRPPARPYWRPRTSPRPHRDQERDQANVAGDVPPRWRGVRGGGLEGRSADESGLVSQPDRQSRYNAPDRARVVLPGYEFYARHAASRTIPIVILEPR